MSIGPSSRSMASLIKSDVIPVLNMFEIFTFLDEYIIAIGGVVEGIELDIEHANAAASIGGIGFSPAPIASVAAKGQS
jgi:hypothetical protein